MHSAAGSLWLGTSEASNVVAWKSAFTKRYSGKMREKKTKATAKVPQMERIDMGHLRPSRASLGSVRRL